MVFFRRSLFLLFSAAFLLLFAGCRSTPKDFTPYVVRIYLEESRNLPASHLTDMVLPVSRTPITVAAKPLFAEWDLLTATSVETEFGPALILMFTPGATKDLFRTSISNQGRRFVLTVNTLPIAGRVIDRPVQDGRLLFFPEIERENVPDLVEGIQETSSEIQRRLKRKDRW